MNLYLKIWIEIENVNFEFEALYLSLISCTLHVFIYEVYNVIN